VSGPDASAWCLRLAVPAPALPLFEAALGRLGGAVVTDALGPDERVPVTLFLDREPEPAAVTALLGAAAAAAGTAVPDWQAEALPETDWVAESHRALPAIRAGRFWLYGSHVAEAPPAGAIAIRIDAGQAFGTGRHETTRGCLLALLDLARQGRPERPLDMGCGSGILAIAMARLWRLPVIAVDSDADAVRLARANARDNGVGPLVSARLGDGYRAPGLARAGPYDLIVANILAGPLCAMAGDLARRLRPGGRAVLSGLLGHQARAVLARHRAAGLVPLRRYPLGEWTTLVLRRL